MRKVAKNSMVYVKVLNENANKARNLYLAWQIFPEDYPALDDPPKITSKDLSRMQSSGMCRKSSQWREKIL